jgi:hypothetical protein
MCATCSTTPLDTESGSAICALPDYLISAFFEIRLELDFGGLGGCQAA